MSHRTIGRIVGALILGAFVAYLTGGALVDSGAGTGAGTDLSTVADNQRQIAAGALLMLANSVIVVGIGLLAFPILRPRHQITAYTYLVTRVFEGVTMAVGVVFLLLMIPLAREYAHAGAGDAAVWPALARVARDGNDYAFQFAMIGLGLGSLLFCRALLRARLVPGFLAVWGLIGYAVFAVGMSLEVLGFGVGLALSIPGGLFEIALGVLLLVRGFPERPSPEPGWLASEVPAVASA